MSIILKNATFIDWQTFVFSKTNLLIEEGKQGKIKFIASIPDHINAEIIDCTDKYVTKSFVCGHHHSYSALSRGMGAPKKNPTNFHEVLQYIWWTLDKCLNKDMIETSAYLTAMSSAKSGTTFVIDHHASPFSIEGSLEIMAKAFEKVGVSHLLCYEISDRDGLKVADAGLQETENYLKTTHGLVGLHASFTVSDNTIKRAVQLAETYQSGIHIHVAEDPFDQNHSLKNYGKRVVERLNDLGVLQFPKSILGHCLHINPDERAIIQKSNAWVVQNTESNLNNKVGFFNSDSLNKDKIMLGTDGMHSDMLRSAKTTFYVGQNFDSLDYMETYRRFRNAHRYLKENNFEGDGENNIVVLDYDNPTDFNQNNFLGHFIFGIEAKHIEHVISNGKIIVKNKKMVNIDEESILKQAQELSKILWKKMQAL